MKVLCLDYGEKRIGVAISDALKITAQPFPFIANTPQFWEEFQTLLDTHPIEKILIGLPKNRHGQDTKMSQRIQEFALTLEEKTQYKPILINESYSSAATTKHLINMGVSRKKRKTVIDSASAAFVLQGYLDKPPTQPI